MRYYITTDESMPLGALLETKNAKYVGTNKMMAVKDASAGDFIYCVDVLVRETVAVEIHLTNGKEY